MGIIYLLSRGSHSLSCSSPYPPPPANQDSSPLPPSALLSLVITPCAPTQNDPIQNGQDPKKEPQTSNKKKKKKKGGGRRARSREGRGNIDVNTSKSKSSRLAPELQKKIIVGFHGSRARSSGPIQRLNLIQTQNGFAA